MQIKETLSQGLKREFDVIFSPSEIETKFKNRLEAIGKKVNIPGFRPGKIPLTLLKQRYKADALREVLDECVDQGVQQVLKDNNLKPSLKPKVNLNSFEEGKDLNFEVVMELLPTIGEISLEGFSFEKLVVTISREEISRVLDTLARNNRQIHPLPKSHKAVKGDIVIIDFEGFVEGKPIEGGSGKNHPLELGMGTFAPGFEEQLIGHEKGARLDINITFPKEYHEGLYANKAGRFDVIIKDIQQADSINIDEALAEKLGFKSLQALEEWVEKGISTDYAAQSFLNIKRHVLDALAERFNFESPQNMVELEFENIWGQLYRQLGIEVSKPGNANIEESKTLEEATGKSEEELKGEYKTIAERRVRLGILLAEIGNRNNITVTHQELLNALIEKAREFPNQEEEVFDFYRKNESAMATLRAPIFENKVIEYVLSQSKVTEKSITSKEFEKLLAFEEEEAEKKISLKGKEERKLSKKKEKVKENNTKGNKNE